ncbi:MAG: TonB-dependent receptor [Sediminibacterium sp.]
MRHFILFIFLALGTTSFAQGKQLFTITGAIKDALTKQPIDGVTIAIVSAKDSSFVKITSSDKEGNFSSENVRNGTYRVLSTAAGYKTSFSQILIIEGSDINMGTLFLIYETISLKDVVVASKKSFIEKKIDKTIINVDASILNSGGTAMEILEAAPGVSVDNNGNISLNGKSGVNIMIDGKPSYLSGQQLTDLLKRMPASVLDQVEIMTNPSAKYDAAGNSGIINIKTKKNKITGFSGNISTGYIQNITSNITNSANMNYRNGKFNLFGIYSFYKRTEYRDLSILRKFKNSANNQIETILDQQSFEKKNILTHNVKLGFDFYASNATTLGIVFIDDFVHYNSSNDNTTLLQNQIGHTDSLLTALSVVSGRFKNRSINLNLKHRFDSTGNELTTDIDYVVFSQQESQLLDNAYFNSDMSERKAPTELQGKLPADVTIYSAKMDYSHPLKHGTKFETGIKSSFVKTDNNALYDNLLNGVWLPDYGKTNRFLYNENINAVYINFNKVVKKWSFQAGLRVENTNATGHQLGNQVNHDSSFRRNYTGLFPTLFISYTVDNDNVFSANIGRRIGRPAYQSLNPFYYFLDDYTYRAGNTQLKPQYTYTIEFSHTYKGVLTSTLNYSQTTDLFAEVLNQNTSERKLIVTQGNIAAREDIGISISASIPIGKFWNSNFYTSLVNNKFNGTVNGSSLIVSATVFTGNISNQFKFKNGWSAELNGWYRSKEINGQIMSDPMWAVNTGIQKEVMKNKGVLKLGIRDVFNSQKFSGVVRYNEIDAKIINNNFKRTATLIFLYRFGKPLKTQQIRNAGSAGDEQSRIKKG